VLKVLSRLVSVRRVVAVAAVVVPFTALAVANPSWARAAGIDVWNVRELERDLEVANRESDRLVVEDLDILNRIHAKEALVDQVVSGRTSLADATAQFLALACDRPQFFKVIRENYPGGTDEERTACNVIDYALQRVADPTERGILTCRLIAELAEMTHNPDLGF
jgi:hypothetical protein